MNPSSSVPKTCPPPMEIVPPTTRPFPNVNVRMRGPPECCAAVEGGSMVPLMRRIISANGLSGVCVWRLRVIDGGLKNPGNGWSSSSCSSSCSCCCWWNHESSSGASRSRYEAWSAGMTGKSGDLLPRPRRTCSLDRGGGRFLRYGLAGGMLSSTGKASVDVKGRWETYLVAPPSVVLCYARHVVAA